MQKLPVELLHCILDNLDTKTIVFSVRHVCRLFRSLGNNYDRYVLNLTLISKRNLILLCRLINPNNVVSLILSNEEQTSSQIDFFISLVHLRQFTRLRSITLLHTNESQLNFILERINLNFLTSFSFSIKKYDDRHINTTNNFLTSMVSKSNIRRIELNLSNARLSQISWSLDCSIQYLIVNQNITMDNLLIILQCSPHLHTIILKETLDEIINHVSLKFASPIYFRQLTSLTMENFRETVDDLESFLLLTPSLVHLKLVANRPMFDGKRWEQFIEINLPNLDKFEFYFDYWSSDEKTSAYLELIIASFRTPFWIEHKKWFVNCACDIKRSYTVYLYSIPICKSFLKYEVEMDKNSLFNHMTTMDDNQFIKSDVNVLNLTLNKILADYIHEKVCYLTKFIHFITYSSIQ
ncbi:unnamed protein product [Rotaria sp. Silwood2]|nr:unnamed protein product [Rotaria sp. Silwood2]CAF2917390.1 unnamed protein product [Rotaria sp. Silwood2]CAF2948137.1 unnamed protein product [Rotaria sp. Silwood2]CAF3117877.1 unnamed protein product [Rotaria sp. Silwood2]CAF4280662.1 unnamed protein product [Rotaria sp. Silwood2]